jgi:hypothetical protein
VPLEPTTLSWLTIATLALSICAMLIAAAAWRRSSNQVPARAPRPARPRRRGGADSVPVTLTTEEVTAEIEALRVSTSTSLRHLAVVRYDAFGDMGGHLSWSMALLDDGGDGVVLTSIHGRSDARTYAKNVAAWTANQQLSPEEEEAISYARFAGD